MPTTTAHGVTKYALGEKGWGTGFNSNADKLEEALDTQEAHSSAISALQNAPSFDVTEDQQPSGVWNFTGGLFLNGEELITQGGYQVVSTLTPVTVTNSTTETVVASYTLPSDTYDAGDWLVVTAQGVLENTSGSSVTVTPTFEYGTIESAGAAGTFADREEPYHWRLEAQVAVGSPESQDVSCRLVVLKSTGEEVWQAKFVSSLILSTARTLKLSVTLGTASEDISWLTTSGHVFYVPASPEQISPVLWWPDYDSVGEEGSETVQGVWFREQEPNNPGPEGPVQTDRIVIIPPDEVPGSGNYKPLGNAMRVMLQRKESSSGANDGDVQGGSYNRSEVYDRYPTSNATSTPPANWPDPVGSERWYAIPVYFPEDHYFATGSEWFTFTQWKQLHGGSPTLSLEVNKSNFRLGGTRQGQFPSAGYMAAVTTGVWHLFLVGIKYSTSSSTGWVQAYLDGQLKIAKQSVATMDTYSGNADPMYLKQGIYRTAAFQVTHTLYFGPTVVGRKRNDVLAKLPDLIAMPS